jgi:hypothetical protein
MLTTTAYAAKSAHPAHLKERQAVSKGRIEGATTMDPKIAIVELPSH